LGALDEASLCLGVNDIEPVGAAIALTKIAALDAQPIKVTMEVGFMRAFMLSGLSCCQAQACHHPVRGRRRAGKPAACLRAPNTCP
jgi:hypothetical protein